MLKWLLVFVAMLIADFCWARWAIHCNEKNRIRASVYAAAIVVCSGLTIFEYTHDLWLVIPAAAGAGAGTFFAVKTE